MGGQSIVGWVTRAGRPRISLDVTQDSIYKHNPELPDTRSEIALPLVVGDRGVAVTPLRPAGKMKIKARVYDVVTRGDFLEKGTPVVVSAIHGNVLIVSKEKPA